MVFTRSVEIQQSTQLFTRKTERPGALDKIQAPQLARSIKEGGIQLDGVMPGFGDQLDDQQILASTAYFQSKWPEGIYQAWHNRHMQ